MKNYLLLGLLVFSQSLAWADGGIDGGGVGLNTHFLVCDFLLRTDSPQPTTPLKVIVTGERIDPTSRIEAYKVGPSGWIKISEFENLKVTRNFYRIAPTDPAKQTFAFRYQTYPIGNDKSIDILFYSTDVDATGLYRASLTLRQVLSQTQDERASGTCRIDVPYNFPGPDGFSR